MDEPKVFSELTINDHIYFVNDSVYSSSGISKIECDPDSRGRILIDLQSYKDDPVSFPDNDFIYEEGETKYTTDKNTFRQWCIPFVEKQINQKENRIRQIQEEIQELRDSIK